MEQNIKNDLGSIRIHKEVISSIALIATKEVQGVARLGNSLKSKVYNLFKTDKTGAIEVNIENNNDVTINIPVIVNYGYTLPEVAVQIQENVRNMVEKSTELNIKHIDVNIQAVEKKVNETQTYGAEGGHKSVG